jgi:hypothetical protein
LLRFFERDLLRGWALGPFSFDEVVDLASVLLDWRDLGAAVPICLTLEELNGILGTPGFLGKGPKAEGGEITPRGRRGGGDNPLLDEALARVSCMMGTIGKDGVLTRSSAFEDAP